MWGTTDSGQSKRLLAVILLAAVALVNVAGIMAITGWEGSHIPVFGASAAAAQSGDNPYAGRWPNANAPVSLLLFRPLAHAPHNQAIRVWTAAGALSYALAVGLLWRAHRPVVGGVQIAWAAALVGVPYTFYQGQVYAFLALAVCGAWLCLRAGRYVAAGLLLGLLVALKPNFALWLLALLVTPAASAGVYGLAFGALLAMVPALVFGPQVYLQWLRAGAVVAASPDTGNGSILGITQRLQLPAGFAVAPILVIALLVVGTWLLCRPSVCNASAVGLLLSLLLSPVAWAGYALLVVPVFLTRRWSRALCGAAALLVVPVHLLPLPSIRMVQAVCCSGSLFGVALVLAWADCLGLNRGARAGGPGVGRRA